MIQVEIPGSYITANDLNNIIARAKTSPKENKREVFKIVALKRLEEVEISFIGYLMLLLEKYPHLHFELNFEHNFKKTDHEFFRKLTQYGTYAYLMLKRDPFLLKLGDGTSHFRLSEYSTFPENWLVHSDSFMLLFLISRRRSFVHQCFFEKSFAQLTEKTPVDKHNSYIGWSEDDEKLFQLYNHAILDSSETKDPDGCLINLGRIAFYKSLRNADFLVKFLGAGESEPKSSKTKSLFQEMAGKPLIYTFVFATLSAKGVLTGDDPYEILETIWSFTKDFVSGLRELVKNIDEHVSNNCGVVAAQVFSLKHGEKMKSGSFLNQYFNTTKQGETPKAVLYTTVFDLGDTGIVPTLQISTQQKRDKLLAENDENAELFDKDLKVLSDREFKVNELFATDKASRLYQQCKRHLVHCGLLRLASLIKSNDGGLQVFTSSLFGRQSFSEPDLPVNPAEEVFHGTCINLILPIRRKTGFASPLQHYLPSDSAKMDIWGIEELFGVKRETFQKGVKYNEGTAKQVIEYDVSYRTIQGDDDELNLWTGIEKDIRASMIYDDRSRLRILCLDFENAILDGSQLLRVAGNLEFNFPDLPVIFKGIPVDKMREFIEINKTISRLSDTLDFWNISNPLVFISYLHHQEFGRFYFTDVFWGKQFACNLHLNRRIARANFNVTSSVYERSSEPEAADKDCDMTVIVSPLVSENGSILPLDLLFTESNGSTYFEQNAFILLQNEFK